MLYLKLLIAIDPNAEYFYDITDQNVLIEYLKDHKLEIDTIDGNYYVINDGLMLYIDPTIITMFM